MNTITMTAATNNQHQSKTSLPTTPRGRALYTVDWFLNGAPVLRNHDNPNIKLIDGSTC